MDEAERERELEREREREREIVWLFWAIVGGDEGKGEDHSVLVVKVKNRA